MLVNIITNHSFLINIILSKRDTHYKKFYILFPSVLAALIIRKMAVIMCMAMPTNGIQAIQEVTMPSMLPIGEPPSFIVNTRVIICKTSIMTSGIQRNPIMMAAPRSGTPNTASQAPVVHFNILEVEIEITSISVIFSYRIIA
jgi:hypothetical protein